MPHCEICIAGRPTGLHVAGQVFEAAVEIDGGFLVFVTESVTLEELLCIHLVSAQGELRDSARIGLDSALGRFGKPRLLPPREVRFQFLGEALWSVEVFARPRWAWPLAGEAPGVRRPWALKRAFRVRANADG